MIRTQVQNSEQEIFMKQDILKNQDMIIARTSTITCL